jgi:hypothetical protein
MIDQDTLDRLTEEADPAISIYLPIDPDRRDVRAPDARLRTLIGEAERILETRGLDVRRREMLLKPVHEIARNTDFAQHRSRALAIFAHNGTAEVFPLPDVVPSCAIVGRYFHVKPLLPFIARNRRFFLLALSAKNVRLFVATPFAWSEVKLDLLPPELQAELDSRLAAEGPSDEARKELLLSDPHRVADAVRAAVGADEAPIVLAAEPNVTGHFTKAAQLRQLYGQTLVLNPFSFSEAELHSKAVELIRPLLDSECEAVIDLGNARLGTAEPTVSLRLEEVLIAARDGRVDAVIVDRDGVLWGRFEPEQENVVAHGSQAAGDEDLLNLAAVLTLRQGGRAFAIERSRIPRQSPVLATLRY